MIADKIIYKAGLPEKFRDTASFLYDKAFGEKLSVAISSQNIRREILENSFNSACAITAIYENKLVGIAGFKTSSFSLTGGIKYNVLLKRLGYIKGNWASLVLSLYDKRVKESEIVMDGIAVLAGYRGIGIGTGLLMKLRSYALEHGYKSIGLSVIDRNHKARKLYERIGFKKVNTIHLSFLSWLFGFKSYTIMKLDIGAKPFSTSGRCL